MFAIVSIAGFQEKVSQGDKIKVPLLKGEEGEKVIFKDVHLFVKDSDNVTIGYPTIAGAFVEAKILGHGQADKIRVFKMRRRKRYRKTQGHRQKYSAIEITKIAQS